jgi:hypothetical protein
VKRTGWLLAFLGFFLVTGAWAVAAPYNAYPDEQDHILRAAGVAAGQVAVEPAAAVRGGGAFQEVPRSLVRDDKCWLFKPAQDAGCAAEPGGDATRERAGSGAGRYHPIYYAVVGWPLDLWPNWTGVLLARLISAALAAALLATALVDAVRWSRHGLMLVGVIVASTPMAAHMSGAVNPSGVEIAAGIALFSAAVPLLYRAEADRSRSLLWHVGIAGFALATLRAAGPLWLVVSAAVLLLVRPWRKNRELLRWRPFQWLVAVLVATMAGSAAWTLIFKTTYMGDFTGGRHWSLGQLIWTEMQKQRPLIDQMVGVLSWLDTRLPEPVYLIWQFAVAGLVLVGFVRASAVGRWRLALLTAAGFGVPFALEVRYANQYGFISQGRYLLPMLVGVPILAAFLLQEREQVQDQAEEQRLARTLRRLYVLLLPLHLVALVITMVRWQSGLPASIGFRSLNPITGDWLPRLGPVTPLVAMAAGLVLLGWLMCSDRPLLPSAPTAAGAPPRAAAAPTKTPDYSKTATSTSDPLTATPAR